MIDLHIHSEFSIDASGSPEAIVEHAAEQDIEAVALTEHEGSTASLSRARKKAADFNRKLFGDRKGIDWLHVELLSII